MTDNAMKKGIHPVAVVGIAAAFGMALGAATVALSDKKTREKAVKTVEVLQKAIEMTTRRSKKQIEETAQQVTGASGGTQEATKPETAKEEEK